MISFKLMSAKLVTSGLLKIAQSQRKINDVIISVDDATSNILSNSVDVVIWSYDYSISIRKVLTMLIL